MIARSRLVAIAVTAVLVAGAACQAHNREVAGRPAPSAGTRGFTLVASGDVLPHTPIIDRARFGQRGTMTLTNLIACYAVLAYNMNTYELEAPAHPTEKPLPAS